MIMIERVVEIFSKTKSDMEMLTHEPADQEIVWAKVVSGLLKKQDEMEFLMRTRDSVIHRLEEKIIRMGDGI